MENSKKLLITHNGSFHTDDIFAAATLVLYLEKNNKDFSAQGGPASGWEIIRTRDEDVIKKGDYVFDVGGIYDPENNRFDHHQNTFEEKRENGIIYSSCGLVWKKFGEELSGSKKAMEIIDNKLFAPIDAGDNGFDLVESKHKIFPYLIQDFFRVMRPTWRETDSNINEMFLKAVAIAKEILIREIIYIEDAIIADEEILKIYNNSKDKKILILNKNYAKKEIIQKLKDTIYIVYPREVDNSWGVEAVREDFKSFKNKKNLPASWGGLRDEELQKVTEIADALFCHKGLFIAVAKSKVGAIKLAELALSL